MSIPWIHPCVERSTHTRSNRIAPEGTVLSSTSASGVEDALSWKKLPDQERLTPERSLELATHSPSGFGWGYSGSGPAQLALALLLNYTEDEEFALDHYQEFKTEVVSQLECTGPDGCWRLTDGDIDAVLRDPSEEAVTPSL